jgi:hypothetical protein
MGAVIAVREPDLDFSLIENCRALDFRRSGSSRYIRRRQAGAQLGEKIPILWQIKRIDINFSTLLRPRAGVDYYIMKQRRRKCICAHF